MNLEQAKYELHCRNFAEEYLTLTPEQAEEAHTFRIAMEKQIAAELETKRRRDSLWLMAGAVLALIGLLLIWYGA